MFASISVNKLFVLSMAMRNHHSAKRRRHVKAHVKLILGNDELMFKRVAACTVQAFSLKFVASLAETFTRHARKIAEGLRGPSIRIKKKKRTGREIAKEKIIGRGKTRADNDMHLCANPHMSDATALPLSSLARSSIHNSAGRIRRARDASSLACLCYEGHR